jgi:dGTPase
MDLLPEAEYEVSASARAALRSFTSNMIAEYVSAISLRVPATDKEPFVKIAAQAKKEVTMLKELTWNYVIHNPALATQQVGFQRIVKTLFHQLFSAAASKKKNLNVFPPLYREALDLELKRKRGVKGKENALNGAITRIILDVISSMTERQALRMYGRLEGVDPGSILDPLYY